MIEKVSRRSREYIEWARNIKRRDKFTCQVCFKKGQRLVSHHLMAYASYPELILDPNNGITLCRKCHNKFHKQYGKGKNTTEQFNEFKSNNTSS